LVGKPLAKHELPKVLVVGNENATLGYCQGQSLGVWHAAGMIMANTGRIMSTGAKVWDQTSIGTLIEKKLHT
jgi:hypothetical protein